MDSIIFIPILILVSAFDWTNSVSLSCFQHIFYCHWNEKSSKAVLSELHFASLVAEAAVYSVEVTANDGH